MYSFIDGVCDRYQSGSVADIHLQYLLNWKVNRDKYAIQHCFGSLLEKGREKEACQLLVDEVYLVQKNNQFEWRYVQEELDYASDYFLQQQNMYKYLYTTMLSRLPALLQQEHTRTVCERYGAFLQLDIAPELRADIGLQKVFNRIFPVQSNEKSKQDRYLQDEDESLRNPPVIYRFIEYHVGDWRCSCGQLIGFCNRQVICPMCKSDCNLSVLEAIDKGTIDILLHDIPIYLIIADSNGKQYTFHLLNIPLLYFMTQQSGKIRFVAPGYFLVESKQAERIIITEIPENCSYDRRTNFLSILEAIFSRTIRRRGKSLKYAMSKMLEKMIYTKDGSKKVVESLSSKFKERLISALLGKNWEYKRANVSQFSSVNLLNTCSTPPGLNLGKTIWLTKHALASPAKMPDLIDIHILAVSIKSTERLVLTTGDTENRLDEFGIVKAGSLVQYNDILISMLNKSESQDMSPEEKLLTAIFGEGTYPEEKLENKTVRWETATLGKIIFRKLYLRKNNSDNFYADCQKHLLDKYPSPETRENSFFQAKEWARVVLFIQSKIQPTIGDVLYTADKQRLVISGYTDELASVMKLPEEIDAIQPRDIPTPFQQQTFIRNVQDIIMYANQSRSTGPYSLISQQPVFLYDTLESGQILSSATILHLYKHGLHHLLFELLICRSDGVAAREQMRETLEAKGHFSVAALMPNESRGVLNLSNFLLAFRIRIELQNEQPRQLRFVVLTDASIPRLTFGEVTKPETINYRTFKPERNGLFCQKIFGPIKHYECECGRYKRERYKGIVCERCGVEVAEKKYRAYRMGHIQLGIPVFTRHLLPSNIDAISIYLSCTHDAITDIIEFKKDVARFTTKDGKDTIIIQASEEIYEWIPQNSLLNSEITYGMGAEGIRIICDHLQQRGIKDPIVLLLLTAITDYVLVIPPDIRPLVPLDDGRFASSDLNDLYRRIIIRNNRCRRLLEINAPWVILRDDYLSLQESVDELYGWKPVLNDENRELRGLKDFVFNHRKNNLLRKSFDYSALTRLLVNPLLDIDECELSLSIACNIFRPFLMHYLITAKDMHAEVATELLDRAAITLEDACAVLNKRLVVVFMHAKKKSIYFSFWCRLSNVPAIRVSSKLIDLLHWHLVGTNVKVIPPFAHESVAEVLHLLPSNQLKKEVKNSAAKTTYEDELLLSFATKEELLSKIGVECPLSRLDEIWMGLGVS